MAVRVDTDDIKEIMTIVTLTDDEIDRFIATANLIIENSLNTGAYDYTVDELIDIERYLSAHFCALKEPRAAAEKVDVLSLTYQGKTGMALDATHYGQTAKMLDRHGVLQNIGAIRLATITAVTSFDT